MSQLGSKLAKSVRQAKTNPQETQQDLQAEEVQEAHVVSPPSVAPEPEAALPLLPTRRVWPD